MIFNEPQSEQAIVELFKKENYGYVYGENIARDSRDVIPHIDRNL